MLRTSPASIPRPLIAYFPYLEYDSKTGSYIVPDFMKGRDQLYYKGLTENNAEVLTLSFDSPLSLLSMADGLLIPGGEDIDPVLYKQRRDLRTSVHALGLQRADFERRMIGELEREVPILGICYGAQILNVLSGGNLIQHVDKHRGGAAHCVRIERDSKLYALIGREQATSHCNHHQIVDALGKDFRVNCRDGDGMVHGIESTEANRWVVAVQWHPERSEAEENKQIFKGFVEKCREFRVKREMERFMKSEEFWLYF